MQLFPHQVEAIESLKCGNILRGGVGSGKSLTALAYYYTKINGGNIDEWDTTRRRVGKGSVGLYIITTASKRNKGEWLEDCLPLGLEPLAIDSWNNIAKYKDVRGSFFIFDEQKVIGNGAWVRHFLRIAKNNRWILLSATPGDNWCSYIPVFIANGFYANRTEFLREHVVFSRFSKYPQIERYLDEQILVRYREAITKVMLDCRTTERIVHRILCKYDKGLYNLTNTKRWNFEEDRPVENANELCRIFRKISNDEEQRASALREILSSHKKIIIFYNYNYELERLRNFCEEQNLEYGEYNGQKHDLVPTSESWAYLVQYTAGSEGWNCITTNATVFYSLPYSYSQLEQAMGRIDRINTTYKDLHYYQLFSSSPIDGALLRTLSSKKNFNEKDFVKRRC